MCGRELQAKISELELKLQSAWTEERRIEHERVLLNQLEEVQKERDRLATQNRTLDEAMLRFAVVLSNFLHKVLTALPQEGKRFQAFV